MYKYLAALILALASLVHANAQSTVTVISTNWTDTLNVPVNGTITLQPTVQNGTPASYTKPGGGTAAVVSVSAPINNGVFSMTVPNTALTSPINVCFNTTAKQQYTGNSLLGSLGYRCLQPHYTASGPSDWCQAGVCNLDNFNPALAPLTVVTAGPTGLTGPTGATGATGPAGTTTSSIGIVVDFVTSYTALTLPIYTLPSGAATTITFPANCSTSTYTGVALATIATTFTVKKNSTTFCIGTVAAGASVITWATGYSATTLAASDALALVYSGDATLAGSIQLNATRNN